MKSNELRIGNYILGETKQITIVDGFYYGNDRIYTNVNDERVRFINHNLKHCSGIRLTKEILLRIKGVEQEGLTFRIGKYVLWVYNNEFYSFMIYNEKDDDLNDFEVYSTELTKVKYLHQLQNVFYSLENEELEISL